MAAEYTRDERAVVIRLLRDTLDISSRITSMNDDERVSIEECGALLRGIQTHCISCPSNKCPECFLLVCGFCQIVYLTCSDIRTLEPPILELAEPRDMKRSLAKRQEDDRRACALIRSSWAIEELSDRFELVETESIGELPGDLTIPTAVSVVHYLVGDDESNYKRVWAIRSALRNSLADICFYTDSVNTDHCSLATYRKEGPEERTRIFTEDTEPPSVIKYEDRVDNTRLAVCVLVALCNLAKKALKKEDVRILLLTKIADAKDGDFVAFKGNEGKSFIGWVHGSQLICADPSKGGIDLMNAYLAFVPGGKEIRQAILTPSDDGREITMFFTKFHFNE